MDSIRGNYRRWNNLTGWLLFVISTIVYLLTLEPTVSFWDCGEFILSAFKLQVGHPPGAPLFLMIGRVATLFAGGDGSKAACDGKCIGCHKQRFCHYVPFLDNNPSGEEGICKWQRTGIGARSCNYRKWHHWRLTYTFSDTFWFSAVEGELYALSSLVTALVFWGMLKWEEEADKPYAGRWIILIAYIMGLGLGIHRLNLLVIPVLVFVFYFKKYEISRNGLIKALLFAVVLLWIMVFVVIPGVPEAAGWFELLFVNVLGMPYNSGLLILSSDNFWWSGIRDSLFLKEKQGYT